MAIVTSRAELISWCLRKLGSPVIQINVDETQIDDRVDEALQVYQEKHFDATEEIWIAHSLTEDDITNKYVTLPGNILSVTEVKKSSSNMYTSDRMFDYNYQISVNELSPFQPIDQINYFMTVTNYEQIMDMITSVPVFEYVRHTNKLVLNDSLVDMGVGYPLVLKVYQFVDPDASSIYNDRWLKEYTAALIKRQWGENLSKHGAIQLMGGVTLNGELIFQQALDEINKLEEQLNDQFMEPTDFFIG